MDGPADAVEVLLETLPDAAAAARRGAELIAEVAREAVEERGSCAVAVSGGASPVPMFAALADLDVPWDELGIWQVDERVAPHGHEDRNLTHLVASLPRVAHVHEMPVDGDADELQARAATYASGLPARFDLVHLGLGDDGHTASLVPGDPVLDEQERDVAITGTYRGRRRMTLTFPVLDRARSVLFLVTGEEKAGPLRDLVARDPSIPAARIRAADQLAIVDRRALSAVASGEQGLDLGDRG
jgi:6-phosphogluconolactonase